MDTDLELCTFYSNFFRNCLKLYENRNLREFKRFLLPERKLESADNDSKRGEILEQDFYLEQFAYLFENNVFTSSAVAVLFQDLLYENANLLVRLIKRGVISICCFSDGTCAGIVAIVLILANASQNISRHFRFNLTIICPTWSWKNLSLKVLKSLEKYTLLREHVKFIGINVSEELPRAAQHAIRNADIVTMVKFFSEIQYCRRRFSAVCKDIFQHLQPEVIVFYLDCAYTNLLYRINHQLSSFLKRYYKARYLHILNLETVKNNFKPFHNAFEDYFFIKLQKICFGCWINVRSTSRTDIFNVSKVDNVPLKTGRNLSKKNVNNTSLKHNSTKIDDRAERNATVKRNRILKPVTQKKWNEFNKKFECSNFWSKRVSFMQNKEAKNKLLQSTDTFCNFPPLLQNKEKKKNVSGKAKEKKAFKQTPFLKRGKKKKKASFTKVVIHSQNFKREDIDEDYCFIFSKPLMIRNFIKENIDADYSFIMLAAIYANTLLTKINAISREDILVLENKIFIETGKNRKKRFVDDATDDGLNCFIPAFNQSRSKNKRWNFWWKKWNWV